MNEVSEKVREGGRWKGSEANEEKKEENEKKKESEEKKRSE